MKKRDDVIVLFKTEDEKISVDVRFDEETVWLTQQQISELFDTARTSIVEHIKHIYSDGELLEGDTCRNFRQVRMEGNRQVTRELPHYDLDMIISIGYRVNSKRATQFRQWATKRLNEYIRKGFTLDDERLKNGGGSGLRTRGQSKADGWHDQFQGQLHNKRRCAYCQELSFGDRAAAAQSAHGRFFGLCRTSSA